MKSQNKENTSYYLNNSIQKNRKDSNRTFLLRSDSRTQTIPRLSIMVIPQCWGFLCRKSYQNDNYFEKQATDAFVLSWVLPELDVQVNVNSLTRRPLLGTSGTKVVVTCPLFQWTVRKRGWETSEGWWFKCWAKAWGNSSGVNNGILYQERCYPHPLLFGSFFLIANIRTSTHCFDYLKFRLECRLYRKTSTSNVKR